MNDINYEELSKDLLAVQEKHALSDQGLLYGVFTLVHIKGYSLEYILELVAKSK